MLASALAAATTGTTQTARPDGSDQRQRTPIDDLYRSPIQLTTSARGDLLFVVCENDDTLLVVDIARRAAVAEIAVGRRPFGVTLSPDGATAYVSNRWDDTVTVIDTGTFEAIATLAVGGDPHGLTTDRSGRVLYVANLHDHNVSLLSTETFEEISRLRAGTQPFAVRRSPDGRQVWVTNQLTSPVPFRTAPHCEVTVIDAERQTVVDRRHLPSTNIAQGIVATPDGELVLVALELPKNLIPETQIFQGWMVTYGLAVLETRPRGRAALLLLDEMNLYYADPFDVVLTPDGRFAYVTSSAVDTVSVVDLGKVRSLLAVSEGRIGISDAMIDRTARHLGLSGEYVVARIATGLNPKGMAMSPDGREVFVANRLSDSITIIDTGLQRAVATIDLGGPHETTTLRRGEYLFNNASISFQRQLACNTCHPENNVDGLAYDIAADGGLGRNLVDNRTLRGVAHTGPYKWSGKNPSLARQEGPRAAQLFFRSHGFADADRRAIVAFLESRPLPPNRFAATDGSLTPAQRRGQTLFVRRRTNDGRHIPVGNRCVTCHPPPYRTDRARHDVGTRASHDTTGSFDTPQLSNLHERAPYLHDGRCWSLEEIWTLYNPYDLHGAVNDMTKQQLNDLVEYLKTL